MHLTLLAPPILTNLCQQKRVECFQVFELSVSLALHQIDQSLPNYNDLRFISTNTIYLAAARYFYQ
jgi:hypothetical protein